jgi:hypothetical protein
MVQVRAAYLAEPLGTVLRGGSALADVAIGLCVPKIDNTGFRDFLDI